MKPQNLNEVNENFQDVWECTDLLEVNEESSVIDGKNIIGRVVGECFFPGKSSRNKRYYSEDLWNKVLKDSELNEKIESRTMFGTVGHDQKIDDAAILEGKISHIVSKLWINENNKGMGEFLILGTPAGNNLYPLLKAGAKIHFSTRASGKYESVKDGNSVLSIDGFILHTIDFVTSPGFLEARPTIIESNSIEEEIEMTDTISKEFVDHLKNENKLIKEERDLLLKDLNENKAKLSKYEVLGSIDVIESVISKKDLISSSEDFINTFGELSKVKALFESYSKLGAPRDIEESLKSAIVIADNYNSIINTLGTPDKINEAMTLATSKLEELVKVNTELQSELKNAHMNESTIQNFVEKYGSLEEIGKVLESMSSFVDTYGSINDVKKVIDVVESFIKQNGVLSEVSEALKLANEFVSTYGSFKDVAKVLDLTEAFINENGSFEKASSIVKSSKAFITENGSFEDIAKVLDQTEAFITENGSFEDIAKVLDQTEAFIDKNGSFDLVEEALEKSVISLNAINESIISNKIETLSEELRVDSEKVTKLMNAGFSEEEIKDILGEVHSESIKSSSKSESQETRSKGASYLLNNSFSINENRSSEDSETKQLGSLASRLMR